MDRSLIALALVAVVGLASDAAPRATTTRITIWSGEYGGAEYAEGEEAAPKAGGLVAETREIDVGNGDVRLTGIAATADPASVHLRDLTEPAISIAEQRFVPGATTPRELLARHIGSPVTVATAKGEVAGVLRAVDEQALVVEVGAGDQKRLAVLRRDGYVQDVRLPAGDSAPSLVWRAATKKPGKHAIELSYRASGLAWSADYLAVLDAAAGTIDFSAWATVKNESGATFDRAELTLVSGAPGAAGAPARFTMPNPVRLGAGDTVQLELLPARVGVKAQPVVTYEAIEDPSAGYQEYPGIDCSENNGSELGAGTSETTIELAVPAQRPLPAGRVRMFLRRGERLDIASEDPLRSSAGVARIKIAGDSGILGQRKALSCRVDENARTIQEKVQVRVQNNGARAVDVVIREYLWRWTVWRLESEDKKGARSGAQTQEYRVRVPPKSAQTVTYSVVYTW